MTEQLKPCPFCGGGTTEITENGRVWTGMKWGEPSSVSVRHWCEEVPGQPSRMLERVGRDHEAAIAAWNCRAQPAQAGAEPVAWLYKTPMPDGTVFVGASAERLTIGVGAPPGSTEEELYTHPPARVPLTEGELSHIIDFHLEGGDLFDIARAVIAAYEAKNGLGGGK